MRKKISICFFLILFSGRYALGQMDAYDYKRELSGISDQWHNIELSPQVLGKLSQHLSDLRIYSITANDTLEAPYILKVTTEKTVKKEIDFKRINVTSNQEGYYYTFKIPEEKTINHIRLDFKDRNFDWRIKLEGSQNQQEWYTLLDDYRVLSIKNERTDYKFGNLSFPDSKYRYYRVLVKSDIRPQFQSASIYFNDTTDAIYNDFPLKDFSVSEDAKKKQTTISVELQDRVPVSFLKIQVSDLIDYYRRFSIQYISDSIKTEKGWKYKYHNLGTHKLTSVEKNEFKVASTLAKKLRITIQNQDNRPLTIKNVTIKGYRHELIARFDQPATHYLVYGNKGAFAPVYDIAQTNMNIPTDLKPLWLGEIQPISKNIPPKVTPLFENRIWLWIIMGVIILVLGIFTLKMMQGK